MVLSERRLPEKRHTGLSQKRPSDTSQEEKHSVLFSYTLAAILLNRASQGTEPGLNKIEVSSCVIPGDGRIIMGNVKLLSSVAEGSVKGSMQYFI